MANIKEKIQSSAKLTMIFSDLHWISLLALACFFTFEKIWPGLISFYLHPAILVIFWLITIILCWQNSRFAKKADWLQISAGIILAFLIFLFYWQMLGPWAWMIVLILPAVALGFKNMVK